MADIEDLKLWRSEPLVKDYINWNFKRPYLGKWWSTDLPFVRDWGTPGNLIYELDLPYPLADKKTKTVLDLLSDVKTVKNYTPLDAHGMAMGSENLDLLDQEGHPQRWAKKFDYKVKPPLQTRFEHAWKNPSKYSRLNIITPEGLDANRKINFWESIKKNFKPTYHFLNRQPRLIEEVERLRNLSGLPRKLWELYKLKQSGAPMVSGINWRPAANVGINTLRGVGLAGDVLLGGMALSDVFAGTSTVGNMAKNINKWAGVPVDRQGNAITNIPAYRDQRSRLGLSTKTSQPFRDFTQTDYGKAFNTGGIASLA